MVAAAARETGDDRGEDDCAWTPSEVAKLRDWNGDEEVEREGGSEFRSGGIAARTGVSEALEQDKGEKA